MTSPSSRSAVLLFGTSANPPTGLSGHAGLVRWAANEARIVPKDAIGSPLKPDQVWVLPVYQHPFSDKRDMPAYEDRRAMARLAFEHLPGLEGRALVKDVERDLVESALDDACARGIDPSTVRIGTIDVVRELSREHPEIQFALLLGGDTYRDLLAGKWKESLALLEEVPLVVVERVGVPLEAGAGTRVLGLTRTSSTDARRSTDLTELRRILQPEVLSYIVDRRLYAFARPSF